MNAQALPSGECSNSCPKSTQWGAPNFTFELWAAVSPKRLSEGPVALTRSSCHVAPRSERSAVQPFSRSTAQRRRLGTAPVECRKSTTGPCIHQLPQFGPARRAPQRQRLSSRLRRAKAR
eukprot:SAG11_NODE_787_length_7169_cov_4.571146_8_plen_120_part_00